MDDPRPYTLVAELTYRCPLRCAYCSNPVAPELGPALAPERWLHALAPAARRGVLQVHFTGGEPLLRADLEALVAGATAAGLYSTLITSGIPATHAGLHALRDAGLCAVQLSFQDTDRAGARRIGAANTLDAKLRAAAWVKALGLPLTANVVLHRDNIDRIQALIQAAERMGADRIELANAQYLGWALVNRDHLLPTAEQLERARRVAQAERRRLERRAEVVFVLPDYHASAPRACMEGWARRYLVIAPDGLVLPCHAARGLPGLRFERIGDRSLARIWRDSEALNAFRGDGWMQPPCRDCDRRATDFAGCRCQAFHLAGDAAAADPACSLSPHHPIVQLARPRATRQASGPMTYRQLRVLR